MDYEVGTIVGSAGHAVPRKPEIGYMLSRYLNAAWFAEHAVSEIELAEKASDLGSSFRLSDKDMSLFCSVAGKPDFGKSFFILHMIREQLEAGRSVVAIEPKPLTVSRMVAAAKAAGIPDRRISVVHPGTDNIPGWNVLQTGLPANQIAETLSTVIEFSSGTWTDPMKHLLKNAVNVLVPHGLSLKELSPFLLNAAYRSNLLKLPVEFRSWDEKRTYEIARDYFTDLFPTSASKDGTIGAILGRIAPLVSSGYMEAMTCSRRQTIRLESLWEEPGAVFVVADTSHSGNDGVKMLSGLFAHQIKFAAMRARGPVPVILSLDEVGVQEKFIASAVIEIAKIAREMRLRLLVACQQLELLPTDLHNALIGMFHVKVYFRLAEGDAGSVARFIARAEELADPEAGTATVTLVDAEPGPPVDLPLYGSDLRPLKGADALVKAGHVAGGAPIEAYEAQVAILKAVSPRTTSVPIPLAVFPGRSGIRAAEPRSAYAFEKEARSGGIPCEVVTHAGPSEIALRVTLPTVTVSRVPDPLAKPPKESDRVRRWDGVLSTLPRQHAVIHASGTCPTVVRVADVDPAGTLDIRLGDFLTIAEIEDAHRLHSEHVRSVIAGTVAPERAPDRPQGTADDGSI